MSRIQGAVLLLSDRAPQWSRSLQILGQLSKILLTVALLFIAWVWLLHFPWL